MQVVWVFLLLKTSLPKHFTNNFEINLLEYIVVETRGPAGEEGQPPPPKKTYFIPNNYLLSAACHDPSVKIVMSILYDG